MKDKWSTQIGFGLAWAMLMAIGLGTAFSQEAQPKPPPGKEVVSYDGSVEQDNIFQCEKEFLTRSPDELVGPVITKNFTPPTAQWSFADFKNSTLPQELLRHFKDNRFPKKVDVIAGPETLINIEVQPEDEKWIKVVGMKTKPTNVGKFPMQCEGNLQPPAGGGKGVPAKTPEYHWAAKVLAADIVLDLKSVTFGGSKNHKVINYNANYEGDGTTAYTSPEWTKTGTSNPICYEKDATEELTAVITVLPSTAPNTSVSIKVKHGTAEDVFTQTVHGGDNTCTFTTTNIKTVNWVQQATPWNLDFTWSQNGTSYIAMGSTTNRIYTIYGSPTGSLTEKRVAWCTLKADTKGSVKDVATAIGPDVTARSRFDLDYSMWADPPFRMPPWKVLDGHRADCVTLTHLMKYSLDLLGTPGSEVRFVYSRNASWSGIWSTSSRANEQFHGEDLGFDSGGWNNYEACCHVEGMWWMGGAGASLSSAYSVLMRWTQPNTDAGRQRQCIRSDMSHHVPYPGNINVPNVTGSTLAAATDSITSGGLTVGTVTTAHSATVPAGKVISLNPAAAASVAGGTAVNLVVSTGP